MDGLWMSSWFWVGDSESLLNVVFFDDDLVLVSTPGGGK